MGGSIIETQTEIWIKDVPQKIIYFMIKEPADSVLEVSIWANWEIIKELRRNENMCQALLEIMEPEIDKIKNETKIRMIIELGQEDGLSDAAIIERIEKKTGVSYEKAEAYLEEHGKQPV
jgi:hypothetical protein